MKTDSKPKSQKKLSIFKFPNQMDDLKSARFPKSGRFAKLPLFLLIVAVIVAFAYVVIPDTETLPKEQAMRNPKGRPVHGNSDDNDDLHKVYEIFIVNVPEKDGTLKYGITSQNDFVTKDGNPRPEYQIPVILKKTDYAGKNITYKYHYENVKGRELAKKLEKELVNKFVEKYQRMPPLQKYPIPDLWKQ